MKRIAAAALVTTIALSHVFWTLAPVMAQTPSQRGNSLSMRVASSTAGTGVSLGATVRLTPVLDAAFAYASIPIFAYTPAGSFTGELDLGLRYHFPITTPGIEPYVGGGISAVGQTAGGTQTGAFVQGGALFTITSQFAWYAGLTFGSAASTSTTSYDLGLQYQFTSRVTGVLGIAGSTREGDLYVGLIASF